MPNPKEVETPLDTFAVNLVCDCGGFYVQAPQRVLAQVNRTQIPHTCNKCGDGIAVQSAAYPRVKYVGRNEEAKEVAPTSLIN